VLIFKRELAATSPPRWPISSSGDASLVLSAVFTSISVASTRVVQADLNAFSTSIPGSICFWCFAVANAPMGREERKSGTIELADDPAVFPARTWCWASFSARLGVLSALPLAADLPIIINGSIYWVRRITARSFYRLSGSWGCWLAAIWVGCAMSGRCKNQVILIVSVVACFIFYRQRPFTLGLDLFFTGWDAPVVCSEPLPFTQFPDSFRCISKGRSWILRDMLFSYRHVLVWLLATAIVHPT